MSTELHATVLTDYLHLSDPEMTDDTGRIFVIHEDYAGAKVVRRCHIYDDDGERYWEMSVELPDPEVLVDSARYAEEEALGTLLSNVGSWLGATELRFPFHPELDCS